MTFLRVAIVGTTALLGALLLTLMWQARDTTRYARGFSQERFEKLVPGMKVEHVYSLLGEPLVVREERVLAQWCYDETPQVERHALSEYVLKRPFEQSSCVFFDREGRVVQVTGSQLDPTLVGMTEDQVLQFLGKPKRRVAAAERTFHYSEPSGEGKFRARIVAVDSTNRVSAVISYEYYD